MVTRIESYSPRKERWIANGDIPPGHIGSFGHTTPDGIHEKYMIFCAADDLHTTIYKTPSKTERSTGTISELFRRTDLETVKRLHHGDPPFLLTVKPDDSEVRGILKFTHE